MLLRMPAVKAETGHRSHTSIHNAVKAGLFTRPVQIGVRSVGWPDDEVKAINAARIAGSTDEKIRKLVVRLHARRQKSEPTTTTSTPSTPPLPGQYWPDHCGHYAGIMRSDDGNTGWHVIKPNAPELVLPKMAWGEYGQDIPGTQSRFDGHANTLAMAEAGSPLAIAIRALPGDCYLPSQAEAALCAATTPQVFQPGYHWTSTQVSRHNAFVQGFEYGLSYWDNKDGEFRAVAVRRIPLL